MLYVLLWMVIGLVGQAWAVVHDVRFGHDITVGDLLLVGLVGMVGGPLLPIWYTIEWARDKQVFMKVVIRGKRKES